MSELLPNNEPSNRPYWLKPMPMRDGQPSAYRRQKMKLRNGQRNGWLMLGLMLLGLVLLSGCSVTQPIPPCVQPTIPTVPVSEWSPPTQTYSSSVQADLLKWEQRLTELAPRQ